MLNLFLFTLIICAICISISEISKNLSESRFYENRITDMKKLKELEEKIEKLEESERDRFRTVAQ